MKQRDVERATRLDAAKNLLQEAHVVSSGGLPENPRLHLYEFSADAQPVLKSVLDLQPNGPSTRLHKSVTTMLSGSGAGEVINALVLLSDGHDHELVNPAKTGLAARAQQIPIYAVALGKQGKVPRCVGTHHRLPAVLLREAEGAGFSCVAFDRL